MAKQLKSVYLGKLDFDQGSIDEIISYLEGVKNKHAGKGYTTLRYSEDICYDGRDEHDLYGDRLETDEEEAARMDSEAKAASKYKEANRREYERLKKIFEPDK